MIRGEYGRPKICRNALSFKPQTRAHGTHLCRRIHVGLHGRETGGLEEEVPRRGRCPNVTCGFIQACQRRSRRRAGTPGGCWRRHQQPSGCAAIQVWAVAWQCRGRGVGGRRAERPFYCRFYSLADNRSKLAAPVMIECLFLVNGQIAPSSYY